LQFVWKKSEDISNFKDNQKPIIFEDTIILALFFALSNHISFLKSAYFSSKKIDVK